MINSLCMMSMDVMYNDVMFRRNGVHTNVRVTVERSFFDKVSEILRLIKLWHNEPPLLIYIKF